MYKVGIFHDFGEEEAFLVVIMIATTDFVHIAHGIEAGTCAASGIDCLEPAPYPITVLISISIYFAMGVAENSRFLSL